MNKIYEIQDIDLELEDVKEKVNELVRAVNNLKCVEEEEPIYEVLTSGDCLVISKNEDGLLVAYVIGGKMKLRRVRYPEGVV